LLSIAYVLARARARYADNLAVWDGEQRLTYGELGERVNALAGALLGMGLRKGDRIAILDVNSQRYLECYYAAAQTGIVLLPLNSRLAPPEIAYILNDAGTKALFFSGPFLPAVEAARPNLKTVEAFVIYGADGIPPGMQEYESLLARAAPVSAITPSALDDICNIYYTSGTTGEPKGVCLTYRNMTASMLDSAVGLGLDYHDIWMHAAPMFHLVDAWAVWTIPLLGGVQVPMQFEPVRFLSLVQTTRTTAAALPPTLINMVCRNPRVKEFDLGSLRFIMFGGSPAPREVLELAAKTIPVNYVHAYGITETSGSTTLQRPEETLTKAGAAGPAVAHVELAVVDDDGRPVPAGVVGEVVIRGDRVMREYWNKEQATADVLKNGWYHSGDMGYLDANESLYIVDRKKDMIISGGENVYSVEVENVLSSHPAVIEAAVIGVPHEQWGEAVKAIVVVRPDANVTEQDLIAHCRQHIAAYKTPKSVEFYPEALPKTSTGKLAKRALRDRYWEGRSKKI
jgi:long-chain acyl-CoA synthetase